MKIYFRGEEISSQALNAHMLTAEEQRQLAEQDRESSETAREANESSRVDNEEVRVESENLRRLAEIERQSDWRKFPEDEEWLDINKIECLAEEIWGYIDDDEFQRLARYDFYPLVIAVNQMVDVARKIRGAEIERQSVTDAEIDEAEDFVKAVANRRVKIDELAMKIFNESNRHWNLIVDALRAYRKPEPCVWCAEKNEIRPIDHIDYYMEDEYGRMRRLMFRHCPNCGRNLIGAKNDRPHHHFQNGNNH